MRAVTCTEGQLDVTDVPDPEPEEGQVLLDVVATGICGSDLHARHHADELADASSLVGYDRIMRPHESVIMVTNSAAGWWHTVRAPSAGCLPAGR